MILIAALLMVVGGVALWKFLKFAFTYQIKINPDSAMNVTQVVGGVLLGAMIARLMLKWIGAPV